MLFSRLCLKVIGWKIHDFPDIPKSITIVAPHTSFRDAFIGRLGFWSIGVKAKLLVASEYFYFPLTLGLKIMNGYPVGGVKGHNAIIDAVNLLEKEDKVHCVICPEGQLAPTDRWNPGFYYMAVKANVPIVVGYLDYKKKEMGVVKVITDLSDKDAVFSQIADCYRDKTAKYPEKFLLPKTIQGTRES